MSKKRTILENNSGKKEADKIYYKGGKALHINKKMTLANRKKIDQATEQTVASRTETEDNI